jgi:ATP-dependent Clp protease ATP-binding subunit ClpC
MMPLLLSSALFLQLFTTSHGFSRSSLVSPANLVSSPTWNQQQQQRRRHPVGSAPSFGTTRSTPTSSSTALYVFERMSEDCIAALVTAQNQAASLQRATVGCEVMLAGCVDRPESPALKRTLSQYRVTWRRVTATLTELYPANEDTSNNNGWLSGFRAAKTDEDRPFDPALKRALVAASKLADQMQSTQIQSHHVFLALLEYQEKGSGNSNSSSSEPKAAEPDSDNKAWKVLQKMNVLDDDVSPLHICESLLQHLQNDAISGVKSGSGSPRELVTGQNSNAKTPTLAECGTDLTQMAQDGLLDPVHGREKEIRACLRTLIRRRKNNVCLIGEPGVGKVGLQLLSQCLPNVIETHLLLMMTWMIRPQLPKVLLRY